MHVRATTGAGISAFLESSTSKIQHQEQKIDGDEREFLLSPFNKDGVRSHLVKATRNDSEYATIIRYQPDEEEKRRCHYDQERNNKKDEMNYDQ